MNELDCRLLQIIRHGVFQLRAITKERFEYFSQLISGCKEMRANSPLEQEDSMVSDYLELLTKPDRPVYYSGLLRLNIGISRTRGWNFERETFQSRSCCH